jgi:hypothetical protein
MDQQILERRDVLVNRGFKDGHRARFRMFTVGFWDVHMGFRDVLHIEGFKDVN